MAQINPNAYPTAYKISHVDSDGATPLDIEFSYDLATLVIEGNISMDTLMDGSNSYGGFDASAHNYWVGGSIYGRAQGNPNDPAYGGVSWSSHQVENPKQNLRWFLKITSNASTPQGENPVRWTPQLDDDELTPSYNPDNEQSMVSAMTNNTIRLKEGGIYSLLYTMYPITKIDLDKIQLYPAFTVIRYAFTYNEDDVITGVTSTVSRYHWNDIKPEDNTPAGANYNADLWLYGFYDEMDSENPSHVKYRYVVDSCYVEQYYWSGKRSASGSGKLSAKINNTAWNFSGDAVLPSNTGYTNLYGYLVPLSEGVFSVGGVSGVMINPVSGLIFGGTATSMNKYISFDTSKTDSMYYRNVNGQGTTMIASSTTAGTGFTLKNDENDMTTASVIISQPYGSLFGAAISPDYDLPGHYELRDNGSILHINQSSGTRNVIELVNAPFPIEKLWQSLASLGVYIVGTSHIPSSDFTLGEDFPSWLYHGEVLSDGTTTGVMIQGEDIKDLPNWDEVDYTPVIPTPTPPGTEGEESGDRIPNNERYFSGAYNFVTQYAMTRQQLGQFGNLLWSSWSDQQGITDMWKNFKMFISADPASDTGSIDIASVMDFILSLQVFPFDLSSLLHTDSTNVCIGTGQYPLAVSGKKLLTINHILDCGTMAIPRPYNDFRDYENMSITAYLPYCGSVELNPGDVVGRSVSIEYSVDTLSGSCTAVLTAHDNDGYLYNVGMINGQISASIPMTATNSGQIRAQRISDVASLAGLAGNTFLGNITQGSQVASGADSNPIGAISSLATGTVGRSFNSAISAQQMFANRFSRGAISCPTLAGGNGIAAFFQPACPYIQMRYGLYQKPDNYDHSVGGVSATSAPLSSYAGTGFTVCENVDISGFTCHEEERSAIKALLESGVYL